MICHGLSTVCHGLCWSVMVCDGLSWSVNRVCHGLSTESVMVCVGLSWSVMVCHGLSWSFTVCHGLSTESLMVCVGLSWSVTVCHAAIKSHCTNSHSFLLILFLHLFLGLQVVLIPSCFPTQPTQISVSSHANLMFGPSDLH